MNDQFHFRSIGNLLLCAGLFLASCSTEMLDADFSSDRDQELSPSYEVCSDRSSYDTDHELLASALAGEYLKTRELVCGVAGCEEVPSVSVLFQGFSPSFVLEKEGAIKNPNGPFQSYETWTFLPAAGTDGLNQIEFIDRESQNAAINVSILDAGPCLLRIENEQGWIEYTRLEEV